MLSKKNIIPFPVADSEDTWPNMIREIIEMRYDWLDIEDSSELQSRTRWMVNHYLRCLPEEQRLKHLMAAVPLPGRRGRDLAYAIMHSK